MRDQALLYGRTGTRDRKSGRADEIGSRLATSYPSRNVVCVLFPGIAVLRKSARRRRTLSLLYNMSGLVRRFIERWLTTERDLFAARVC